MSAAFRNMSVSSFAIAVALSFALIACSDDSSSTSVIASNNEAPVAQLPDIPCADTLLIDGHYFEGTNVFYKCEDNKWSYVEEKDVPPGIEVPNYFAEYDKAIWKLNKCTADNEGAVQSEWEGNEKYGGAHYYRCEGGSWVQGNISLTCDTEGVQVGDTCVTHPSQSIFQAGMNPAAGELIFVYKGDGVWERDNQAQIDSLIERQNRRDAAMKEYCGEPESGKVSECCYPVPDEFAADYADNIASILYTSEPESDDWDLQGYFENKNCVMDAEEAIQSAANIKFAN